MKEIHDTDSIEMIREKITKIGEMRTHFHNWLKFWYKNTRLKLINYDCKNNLNTNNSIESLHSTLQKYPSVVEQYGEIVERKKKNFHLLYNKVNFNISIHYYNNILKNC